MSISPILARPLKLCSLQGIIKTASAHPGYLRTIWRRLSDITDLWLLDRLLMLASDPFLDKQWGRYRKTAASLVRRLKLREKPSIFRKLAPGTGLFGLLVAHALRERYHIIVEPAIEISPKGPLYFDYALGFVRQGTFDLHAIVEVKRLSSTSNLANYVRTSLDNFIELNDAVTRFHPSPPIKYVLHVHLIGDLARYRDHARGFIKALETTAKYGLTNMYFLMTSDENYALFSEELRGELQRVLFTE